jgi:hypothetical protein
MQVPTNLIIRIINILNDSADILSIFTMLAEGSDNEEVNPMPLNVLATLVMGFITEAENILGVGETSNISFHILKDIRDTILLVSGGFDQWVGNHQGLPDEAIMPPPSLVAGVSYILMLVPAYLFTTFTSFPMYHLFRFNCTADTSIVNPSLTKHIRILFPGTGAWPSTSPNTLTTSTRATLDTKTSTTNYERPTARTDHDRTGSPTCKYN